MRLTKLLPEDEASIRRWTEAFLVDHLRWWSDATGLGWDDAAIARHIEQHGLAAKDHARLYEAAARWETNIVLVAREDEPVGAIWAETRTDPFLAMQLGVIAWIYVAPEARGHGVGVAMVEAAKGWMRAMEIDLVQLSVVGANAAAVRMYEKAGLRAVDLRMFGRTG